MNVQEVKNKLPFGAITAIAKLADKNKSMVYRYFEGTYLDLDGAVAIAIKDYLKDLKVKRENAESAKKEIAELI